MKAIILPLLALLSLFSVATARDGILQNGDVFEMRLSGPPDELTKEFNIVLTVNEDSVNIPLIGRLRASGMSSTQFAQHIEQRLKDGKIFTVANVNITMHPATPHRTIIIGGSVRTPGRQEWMPDLTLTAAISAAGGPNEWAKDGVNLVRAGRATKYSRRAVAKDPGADPKVQPGDFIQVEGE